MFQLSEEEFAALRLQFATLKPGRGQHRKYLPYVFTEHGAIMAASRETKSGLRGQGLTQAPGSAQPVKIQRHRTVGATDSVAVSRQEWVQMDSGDFKKTAIARH